MRGKRVFWSMSMNSASQVLSASDSDSDDSTCFLQYSITRARVSLLTLGTGITLSTQSSSIKCFIVSESIATLSSISNVSLSELLSVMFFFASALVDDIVVFTLRTHTNREIREIVELWLESCGRKSEGGVVVLYGTEAVSFSYYSFRVGFGVYLFLCCIGIGLGINCLSRGHVALFYWLNICRRKRILQTKKKIKRRHTEFGEWVGLDFPTNTNLKNSKDNFMIKLFVFK